MRNLCSVEIRLYKLIALKDMKDSYPIYLADYAVTNKIQDEPLFA